METDDLINDGLLGHILAQIGNSKAVVLQDQFHDILTDIMDVAMYRRNNKCTSLRTFAAIVRHQFLDFFESRLRRFGRHQELWQIDFFLFKILTHDIECRNNFLLDDLQWFFLGK